MRTSGLRISDFEILLEVERTLSFSRAGETLYYSAQRLHKRVRSIEDALGVQLFARHGRGLALTPAGKDVLAEARGMLDAARRMEAVLRDIRAAKTDSVVIGVRWPAIELLLPLVPKLAELDPGMRIHLESVDDGSAAQIPNLVAAGILDVGIVRTSRSFGVLADPGVEASGELDYTRWREQHIVIVCAADRHDDFLHEIETGLRIHLFATAASPNSPRVIKAWRDQGIDVRSTEVGGTPTAGAYEAVKLAARSGLGVAIVPRFAVEYELRAGSMRLVPSPVELPSATLHMVTLSNRRASVDRVVRFLQAAPE